MTRMNRLSHFQKPEYFGGSILNLISSIQSHFGLHPQYAPLQEGVPFQNKVVLLVIDGLGKQQLGRHQGARDLPVLNNFNEIRTLGSVFPSSTMAAMTTLHMGAPPAQTGWLSGCLWLEELGQIVNTVHSRDEHSRAQVNLDFMRTTRSVYQQLSEIHVKSTVIYPAAFMGSFLSNWHHEGASEVGYFFTPNSIPTLIKDALTTSDYVVVYYPHYDDICHRYSPESPEATDEIQGINNLLERILQRLPEQVTVLLTADHGHKSIHAGIWVDQHPEVHEHLLRPISGEKVARYLHVKSGHLEAVQEIFGQWADVVPSQQLWEEGYFGGDPAHQTFLSRTGDLVALTRGFTDLHWEYHPEVRNIKGWKGNHGGLSEIEMLVPLGILNT